MRLILRPTLLALAFAVVACGGGNEDEAAEQQAANKAGAESTVRAYLTALVEKNGGDACSKFTPEYQRAVLRQNREFAREEGADDCPGLIDAITRASPSVTFEGQRLTPDTVKKLRLQVTVRQSGEAFNATVTGLRGMQRYELETRDGDWLIAKIERVG